MKTIRELWALDEALEKIVQQIQMLEEKRNSFASILRSERHKIDLLTDLPLAQRYIVDNHLARQVTPTELSGLRVCGVDGGLLKNTLRGVELVITRANATIFEYTPSNRVSAIYFPEKTTLPTVKAELTPISRREAELNASLERLKGELELAIRVQDHHPAELLLLDGSLRPHLNDRPSQQSIFSRKYGEIIELFEKLYTKSEETGTLLAGVVKDSRSQRFIHILGEILPHLITRHPELEPMLHLDYRSVLQLSYDSDFFFRILDVGERSPILRLDNSNIENTLEGEGPNQQENGLVCFYLRTAEYDYPLRVEVFTGSYDPKSIIEKIGAMLLPMSSDNEEFALPSVLIDADSQARLIERDLEFLLNQLTSRIGYPESVLKLRRERMPFQ
ncbi:MAG: DNA double-strand break repair nuclease NurA [Candidatus Hermodarchaeota archaeon]|nr:DNA double-strand break repair nuclease NurA [Candidatus Hermodarchaeota archaeon]